jgi:DNA-binding GntR family transcriptional regulator
MSQLEPDAEFSDNEQWYNENIIQSKNTLAYHNEILNAVIGKKLNKAVDILENHLQEVKNRLQPFALQNNSR